VDYEPWCGSDYYGWDDLGYGYVYVRGINVVCAHGGTTQRTAAAVIENIYDRWQGATDHAL